MRTRSSFVIIAVVACLLASSPAAQIAWPTKGWPTAAPRDVGLDEKVLTALDAEIAAGKYGYMDSMLVIRRGKIAFERSYAHDYDQIYADEAKKPGALNAHDPTGPYNYFNPWWHPFYRRGDLHTMQSVTKTVTSVVIGAASARKEFPGLDTPVLTFFDAAAVKNVDDRKRRLNIRHMLTMTDGMDWNENLPYADPNNTTSAMEASSDWVQFAIDRPMAREPGGAFNYNSGATQLLAHIFRKATGTDIEEYADRYLFKPLGIERYYWKRTPTGLIDTEGGLYLRPQDLAKIAYLYLKNGVWDGKVIVESSWVKASIAPSVSVSADVKYGYKWWLYPHGPERSQLVWAGSGFGGQRPLILPEYDLVAVFTAWNVRPRSANLPVRVAIDRLVQAVIDPR